MASPQVRRLSHKAEAHSLNKLLKEEDDTSNSQAEVDEASQSSGQTEYEIKAIIGEWRGNCKVDWADNPVTGESYSPTWEPKKNISTEALAVWHQRKQERAEAVSAGGISRRLPESFQKHRDPGAHQRAVPTAIDKGGHSLRNTASAPPTISPDGCQGPRVTSRILRKNQRTSIYGKGGLSPTEIPNENQRDQTNLEAVVSPNLVGEEIQDSYPSPNQGQRAEGNLRHTRTRSRGRLEVHNNRTIPSDCGPETSLYSDQCRSASPHRPLTLQVSTQPISSSVELRRTSSVPIRFEREGIVPDSQPLPGSSSFEPSSGTTAGSILSFASARHISYSAAESSPRAVVAHNLPNPQSLCQQHRCQSDPIEYTPCAPTASARRSRSVYNQHYSCHAGRFDPLTSNSNQLIDLTPFPPSFPTYLGAHRGPANSASNSTFGVATADSVQVADSTQYSSDNLPQRVPASLGVTTSSTQSSWMTSSGSLSTTSVKATPPHRISHSRQYEECDEEIPASVLGDAQKTFTEKSKPAVDNQGRGSAFLSDRNCTLTSSIENSGTSQAYFQSQIPFLEDRSSQPGLVLDGRLSRADRWKGRPSQSLPLLASPAPGAPSKLASSQIPDSYSGRLSTASHESWPSAQIREDSPRLHSPIASVSHSLNLSQASTSTSSDRILHQQATTTGMSDSQQPSSGSFLTGSTDQLIAKTPSSLPVAAKPPTGEPKTVAGSTHQASRSSISDKGDHTLSSSPLLLPLSGLPMTGYDRTPPRLDTPSRDGMSDPSSSLASTAGLPLSERLAILRAESLQKTKAREMARALERATKSPSVIPARQVTEVSSTVEPVQSSLRGQIANETESTTVEYRDQITDIGGSSLPEMSQQVAENISAAGAPVLGNSEYLVALSMNARIRDQYQQVLFNHRHEIEAFTRAEDHVEANLIVSMERMVQSVKNISLHPDLENEGTLSQPSAPAEEEAKWAESCSAKFIFLGGLLDRLRNHQKHVAVMAQSGQILDIIENFFRGINISYKRPDTVTKLRRNDGHLLEVTLLSTSAPREATVLQNADAVIVMDCTLDMKDRKLRGLRKHLWDANRLAPLITLIIMNSIDHVELCISKEIDPIERLQAVVSCITQARHDVGELPEDFMDDSHAASQQVADFLLEEPVEARTWKLPMVDEVNGLRRMLTDSDHDDSSTQSVTQEETEKPSSGPQPTSTGLKRYLENDADHGSPKKARLDNDDSDLASSITGPSQMRTSGVSIQTPLAGSSIGSMRETQAAHESQASTRSIIVTPNGELLGNQQRVKDYEAALSDLQYRFEEQVKELRQVRAERDAALNTKSNLDRQREARLSELTSLREERNRLQTLLGAAQIALQSSSIPEIAELAKTKASLHEVTHERDRLEKRLGSITHDFDFTRQQYQAASSAAAEASSEVSILQEAAVLLTERASGEAAKARSLSASDADLQHLARIRQLEMLLKEREEILARKEEELRANSRAKRVVTRAGSVPSSPGRVISRASSPNVPPQPGKLPGTPLRYGLN